MARIIQVYPSPEDCRWLEKVANEANNLREKGGRKLTVRNVIEALISQAREQDIAEEAEKLLPLMGEFGKPQDPNITTRAASARLLTE